MSALTSFETRDTLLPFIWYAWLVITPAGPILGWLSYKKWPKWTRRQRIRTIAVSGVLLACTILSLFSRWSLRSFIAESALVALGYISGCELTWLIAREKPRWIRMIGPIISTAFSILLAVFVYTGLGFFFVVGDMIPTRNQQLGHNLVLHMTEAGGATVSHNSATIDIAKRSPSTPGLEHNVYSRFVRDDECEPNLLHIAMDENADQGEVFCGPRSIDQFHLSQ